MGATGEEIARLFSGVPQLIDIMEVEEFVTACSTAS